MRLPVIAEHYSLSFAPQNCAPKLTGAKQSGARNFVASPQAGAADRRAVINWLGCELRWRENFERDGSSRSNQSNSSLAQPAERARFGSRREFVAAELALLATACGGIRFARCEVRSSTLAARRSTGRVREAIDQAAKLRSPPDELKSNCWRRTSGREAPRELGRRKK